MNVMYLALAIGFGYWIGNSKSPQIVVDLSKCPSVLQQKVDQLQGPSKQVQPTTVEPINQSNQNVAPSTKNDVKQDQIEQVRMENGHIVIWSGTSEEYDAMLLRDQKLREDVQHEDESVEEETK